MEVERERRSSMFLRGCSSNFDRIFDELVSEILNRLPIKAVHRCKSVCKRWRDLISTDHFVTSYIGHKTSKEIHYPFFLLYQKSRPYGFELNYRRGDKTIISLLYATDETLVRSPRFNMLSPPPPWGPPIYVLSSSSNGLLLCTNAFSCQTRYRVCNPLTKCWISTPSPPTVGLTRAHIGFFCKDFNRGDFVIVRIPNYAKGHDTFVRKVEIYDSEIGQWAESELDDNWRRNFFIFRVWLVAVVSKGLLHWRGFDCLFIYDTNNNNYKNRCTIVKLPPETVTPSDTVVNVRYLDICKGQLIYTRFEDYIFRVWKLKDDYDVINKKGGAKGECWDLLHNVLLNQMEFDRPNLVNNFVGVNNFKFLGIHPFDQDVVFIYASNTVMSCNMREKTVTYICCLLPGVNCYSVSYLVVLPWWPVPLSNLVSR